MIDVEVEVVVKDKNGKIKLKRKEKSKSWVKNFIRILRSMFNGANEDIVNVNGSTEAWMNPYVVPGNSGYYSHVWFSYFYAFEVGSGTTAVSPDDYDLVSVIPDGTGDGELAYSSIKFTDVENDGTYAWFTMKRTFTNYGYTDVNVGEVGLKLCQGETKYGPSYTLSEPPNKRAICLVFRHVFDTVITLKHGDTLEVTIIPKITITEYYVENFIRIIKALFKVKENVTLQDGSMVQISLYQKSSYMDCSVGVGFSMNSPDNNDTFGILIGSDNTPETITDYALGSKYAQDTVNYETTKVEAITTTNSTSKFKISRVIAYAGQSFTVGEIGGIIDFKYSDWWSDHISHRYILIIRKGGLSDTVGADNSYLVEMFPNITT